jgi:hypothetical protein
VPADPLLRRLERTAVVVGGVMAVVALVLARGRPGPALGVAGGWLLMAIAYRGIVAGVDLMVEGLTGSGGAADPDRKRRRVAAAMVKIAGRYALLAVLAYVMIARLRLHPLGLMAGASSAVAAAGVEAVRFLAKKK